MSKKGVKDFMEEHNREVGRATMLPPDNFLHKYFGVPYEENNLSHTPPPATLQMTLIRPDAILPTYAHTGDSGMDVYSTEDVLIQPQETELIPIGIQFDIPFGYELQIRPRSGISLNTMLRIANQIGTVDSGFKNEVKVIMHNSSETGNNKYNNITLEDCKTEEMKNAKGSYLIRKGDKIAQLVFAKVEYPNTVIVTKFDGSVEKYGDYHKPDDGKIRGKKGFGSSGIKLDGGIDCDFKSWNAEPLECDGGDSCDSSSLCGTD